MKVQPIDTPYGERYLLIDDNFDVVKEVHDFLKFCDSIQESNTSQQTYCYNLKIYYDYLNIIGIKYNEIFDKKKNGKSAIQIMGGFVTWLQFPDKFNGIINIDGEEAKRQNVTVNSIMNTVLKFYDFLARSKELKELDVYKTTIGSSTFKNFMSELRAKNLNLQSNILKLKVPKKKLKKITDEEFKRIYSHIKSIRDKAIISLLFYSGIRRSELIAMRISDINFQENIIYVRKHDNTSIKDGHLKNNSEGYIMVPNFVMNNLMEYINNYRLNDNSDILFVTSYGTTKGQPLTKENVNRLIKKYGKKENIHLTPHMLRHSYAASHMKAGAELIDIQKDLRHKQITTTEMYLEFDTEDRKNNAMKYCKQADMDFAPDNTDMEEIGGKLI